MSIIRKLFCEELVLNLKFRGSFNKSLENPRDGARGFQNGFIFDLNKKLLCT